MLEEREAKLRDAEQRATEREAALRRDEEEKRAQETTAKAAAAVSEEAQRPQSYEIPRERPGRERDERPGDADLQAFMRKAEQDFRSVDRDGDGYLSRDEVRRRYPLIERDFARVDTDSDGRISLEEFLRLRRYQFEQRYKKR